MNMQWWHDVLVARKYSRFEPQRRILVAVITGGTTCQRHGCVCGWNIQSAVLGSAVSLVLLGPVSCTKQRFILSCGPGGWYLVVPGGT